MKVLCIGETMMEITCPVNSVINEGLNISIEEKYESGSGQAGNVAYLLGKWGVETYIASMVGSDDEGNVLKREYETIGVKTDFIETNFEKGTSKSIALVNSQNKNNTVINIISNAHLKKYIFNIEPDIIVSDCSEFNASVSAFDKFQKSNNFIIASKNNNELIELCRYAKNIIFNMNTAEEFSGIKINFEESTSIVNVYNKIKQRFPNAEIIITLGDRGVAYSINNQIKILPPVKVDVVDSHGAKDVFVGAYIYAMGRNFGLEKSLCYATIAASLSTTKMTIRGGIPALTEVSNYYDSKFGTANNPINKELEQQNETLEQPTNVNESTPTPTPPNTTPAPVEENTDVNK